MCGYFKVLIFVKCFIGGQLLSVAWFCCIAETSEDWADLVHDGMVHVCLQSNIALVVGATDVGHVSLWRSLLIACCHISLVIQVYRKLRGYSIRRIWIRILVNVLEMRAWKHVHSKLSCTRFNDYTIVYTNMAAVTKFIAKIIKLHQPVKQRDILAT